MHSIKIGKYSRNLPQSWDEVTQEQLIKIVPSLFREKQHHRSYKTHILFQLLDIPKRLYTSLAPEQVYDLIECIRFVDQSTDKSIIKHFVHMGTTFYGPKDNLSNISLIEFAYLEEYYQGFHNNNADTVSLNNFISVLYRPAKHGAGAYEDQREPFNEDVSEPRSSAFETLPLSIKMSVLLYFAGCKKVIAESYSILFEGEEGTEGKGNTDIINPLFGIIYDLAKTGIFGDFKSVAATNLHTVLIHLVREEQLRRKQKANGG